MVHIQLPPNAKAYNNKHVALSCICQSAELVPTQAGGLQVSRSHETGSWGESFLQHILLVASEAQEGKTNCITDFQTLIAPASLWPCPKSKFGKYFPPTKRDREQHGCPTLLMTHGERDIQPNHSIYCIWFAKS